MGADFYQAAIPEPVTLLGVRLMPFSLGHVLLLNRFDNAFGTGETPTLADLIQGIVICSQTYADAIADLDNPALPEHVAKWQKRLIRKPLFGKSQPSFSPHEAANRFAQYVRDGSSFPLFSVDPSKTGQTISVPLVQSVKIGLQSKLHLTDDQVLNRPWGLCLWDYFTLQAIEGNCKIADAEDTAELQKQADALHLRMVERMGLN